ncbi:glutathione S-transferase family protein [Parvibaculum sp.]|uniref:glutathione S-transferase family protein n=1 Tax=Parvibaculum sp. TaxID=2024848 RepID=UPI00320F1B53
MGLIVYGAPLSPFVRKVRVVLSEKGLDYKLDPVTPFPAPDWFVEISPLGRIPVLRDEDVGPDATLPDSSVICAYLERKKPEPALFPKDNYAYGRALWFEEYADSELAANIGMGVFRPVVLAKLMGQPSDRAAAEKTIADKLPKYFSYLDKEIGAKEFLVGGAFSIADISVATHFVNFAHAGYTPDEKRWPNLARFLKAIHARPSFAACIAEESAFVAKLGL